MISGIGAAPAFGAREVENLDPAGEKSPDERLRESVEAMEGVFVQELTKALRATVPNGGNPDAPGADMYSSLLDERLAHVIAADTRTGIAEALYRQLSGGRELGDPPITTELASMSDQGRES